MLNKSMSGTLELFSQVVSCVIHALSIRANIRRCRRWRIFAAVLFCRDSGLLAGWSWEESFRTHSTTVFVTILRILAVPLSSRFGRRSTNLSSRQIYPTSIGKHLPENQKRTRDKTVAVLEERRTECKSIRTLQEKDDTRLKIHCRDKVPLLLECRAQCPKTIDHRFVESRWRISCFFWRI